MTRTRHHLVALSMALLLFAHGCTSARTARTDDVIVPMRLDRIVTTDEVTPGAPAAPKAERHAFHVSDPRVVSYVRFHHCLGAHVVVFRWYDPSGHLYTQSDPIAIRPTGAYHEAVAAWHAINLAGERAASLPGTWSVTVFLDGALVASTSFRVEL